MATYVFNRNYQILGLSGVVAADLGTVNTNAVNLSAITKVDPLTGRTYTFAAAPTRFTVQDLPQGQITITYVGTIPSDSRGFPQKARVTRGTNQSLTSATWTQVQWDTLSSNPARVGIQLAATPDKPGDPTTPGALYPQVAGQYIVQGVVSFRNDATNMTDLGVRIKVNGTVILTQTSGDSLTTPKVRSLVCQGVLDLKVGDYVTVEAQATTGTPLVVSTSSWFAVTQLH